MKYMPIALGKHGRRLVQSLFQFQRITTVIVGSRDGVFAVRRKFDEHIRRVTCRLCAVQLFISRPVSTSKGAVAAPDRRKECIAGERKLATKLL